jgi:hypothetical protein
MQHQVILSCTIILSRYSKTLRVCSTRSLLCILSGYRQKAKAGSVQRVYLQVHSLYVAPSHLCAYTWRLLSRLGNSPLYPSAHRMTWCPILRLSVCVCVYVGQEERDIDEQFRELKAKQEMEQTVHDDLIAYLRDKHKASMSTARLWSTMIIRDHHRHRRLGH